MVASGQRQRRIACTNREERGRNAGLAPGSTKVHPRQHEIELGEEAHPHPGQHSIFLDLPLVSKPAGMAALGRAHKIKEIAGREELAALMHFYGSRAP